MDFSRLHMYTPPQCVPENTGYTYALSSSYSSDALAFETEHRLDPVFDSPRMSRRSLRLVTTACATEDGQARDTHSCSSSTASLKDRAARTVKQRRSASKPAFSINHTSRKVVSCGVGQSGTSTLSSAACLRPPVLDESLIREQTKVDHFWGKAASGIFWWLGIGWYQFVTLISWLNVFLLTRCLRNICKFLILLIPLLLLLGGGLSLWGQGDFLSGLPVFNWTRIYGTQRVDSPESMFTPDASQLSQDGEAFHEHRMSEVERQMTSLSGQCHSHEEKLRELATVLQTLQARVDQMDGDGEATLSLVQRVVGQHLKEISADGLSDSQTDTVTFRQEHELRLSNLEDILGKLTQTSEAIQKELEQTKLRTASGAEEEQRLLSVVKHLEEELGHLKSELSSWQHLKTSCEEVDTIHGKVDAQVRETVKLMFSDGEQGGSLKWLLQTVSSQFVSRDDLQVLLRDLELQILKNITHYISVTKQVPDSETVVSAANEAGISGITEAQARVIVNNALKLYSQDKTGMVDFALESGGGSILSTRCSETYETKTALISLFGIPLWYFSQSPRVVIQPDIHPGNCWAFRGSQGYLVVRLSMKIRPTAFTLEHIPKTLSPTGNITSAPKDFAVYGLEDEYQEEGQLLGQFTYDQEGESLQMFHVPKRPEGAFQIVELRIFSNWGHPEYTCLYRFRVHGEPIK
ncbi:SUN domain-containing protein 1 isoform X10 [Canis lupus familiaris]|uniref:SUN domain-containing protein 1 isoform X14 n=1 Tax=Canis lupus dingo TaxID=286419 RepID=UPI0015F1909B|nr:SUN domain-containing protein 1 isoform X14 [Canis lupus dingo]XP_038395641.1 SUN domain-containing protein 1 isoform X10 [Canis lupus familiaris]XP_038524444.1 SUN domain-containing protein 1 isoform X10 [Canis lupus familiaris]